jgi:hypothetical protein
VAFDTAFNRASGSTSVGLTADKFTRTDLGVPSSGQDYTISASDNENFGSQAQNHSLLNLTYSHLDDYNLPTDLINAIGQMRLEHSDRLTSLYTLNYARNEFGDFLTESLNGTADLRHQLFDSLTTDLNLQGYSSSSSSGLEQQNTWQFGGGPGLNYVKQMSPSSTVTDYASLLLLHSEVESTGGVLPVIDEQHTFGSGGNGAPASSFFLLQPNVIVATIVITDTTHQPPAGYIQGIDFLVVPNGQLILIQRIAGSRMPDSVLVSYSYNASPSGGYDSINDACGVRFDFFNHHWGLYARLQVNRNYGDIVLPVQNLNDFVVGTDASWRFIRVGVEYESYDSNLSTFQAARLSQNFSFQPEDYSTLTLNLTETFTHYEQANLDEENYTAIVRYSRSLGRHWSMSLETGVNQMVGTGVDQTLAVFRPLVEYTAGSFSASLGYDFGYDEYLSTQTQTRNLGYIRLKKAF